MAMNVVILTGRLVADPEVKYTQGGKAYARFSLAVSRRQNREETDFINIMAWEKKAELVAQYLKKGALVGVTGSLRTRSFDDKEGKKVKLTEVLLENIEFFDTKKGSEESSFKRNDDFKVDTSDEEFPF